MEIERKFKIKKFPDNLFEYESKKIEQGYLCINPVVRIRQCNNQYILTYKNKQQISENDIAVRNEEIEMPLTKEGYLHLREKIDFHLIKKTRYIIPLNHELVAELDIFEGNLKGLSFIEVEFPDEKAAKEFIIPDWFSEDVSFDRRYHNSQLAKFSSIEELGLEDIK